MPAALFIGRFQPFHLGHLQVIQEAILKNERLLIAIGSAETNFRPTNPFTASERFQMIETALMEVKISREKYTIIPLNNIQNYAMWPKHVELYLPPFERIYTGSETVKHLYENYNFNRKNPYKIIDIKKELKISGTRVRELMLHQKSWEKFVPKSVETLIKKWNGVQRLKNIQEDPTTKLK